MKSLLGVPVMFKGRAVGDLYLTDKIGAEEFSAQDQELLVLLASHAAVAIENARLYEETRVARDRLQVWNEALEAKVAERTREIERYSKEVTTRVLQAQEEERKRIARELHDETAQALTTLLVRLKILEKARTTSDMRRQIDELRELTAQTLEAVRKLAVELRPATLDDLGLLAALEAYAESYSSRIPVRVSFRSDGFTNDHDDGRLPPQVELVLYRVVQEALTNVAKHADAKSVQIELHRGRDEVMAVVTDDGLGFNVEEMMRSRERGLGLFGMQERLALVRGQLVIDSSPGRGTTIHARVPSRLGAGLA
jgi:two-component system sensor histidine kinase UhpB